MFAMIPVSTERNVEESQGLFFFFICKRSDQKMAALHPEMVCRALAGITGDNYVCIWALRRTLALSYRLSAALNFSQIHSLELPALGSSRELQSPIPFRQWDQVLAAVEVRLKCSITQIFRLPTMSTKKKQREKPTILSKLPPVHP